MISKQRLRKYAEISTLYLVISVVVGVLMFFFKTSIDFFINTPANTTITLYKQDIVLLALGLTGSYIIAHKIIPKVEDNTETSEEDEK